MRLLSEAKGKVQKNADDANTHYKLGKVYGNLNRHQEAITSYKNAVRINPDLFGWLP